MATKKAAPVKKAATKKAPAAKISKGDKLECGVCGMSVIVDELSDTVGFSEIICCGVPLKAKKAVAKKATAKKVAATARKK